MKQPPLIARAGRLSLNYPGFRGGVRVLVYPQKFDDPFFSRTSPLEGGQLEYFRPLLDCRKSNSI